MEEQRFQGLDVKKNPTLSRGRDVELGSKGARASSCPSGVLVLLLLEVQASVLLAQAKELVLLYRTRGLTT